MMGINKNIIIQEVKINLIKELKSDIEFNDAFKKALNLKKDIVILNGKNIEIKVLKK